MNSRRLRLSTTATLRPGPVQQLQAFCFDERPRLGPPRRQRAARRIGRFLPKD